MLGRLDSGKRHGSPDERSLHEDVATDAKTSAGTRRTDAGSRDTVAAEAVSTFGTYFLKKFEKIIDQSFG